jgi:hypothetical protein
MMNEGTLPGMTAYGPSAPEERDLTPAELDAIREKRRALIEARVKAAMRDAGACWALLDWSPDPLGVAADIITAGEAQRSLVIYRRLWDIAADCISEDDAADALRREGVL